MKIRVAFIGALALLGTGCGALPDFMKEALGPTLKTEIQTALETTVSTTIETVTASVLDQVLGGLTPTLPTTSQPASN